MPSGIQEIRAASELRLRPHGHRGRYEQTCVFRQANFSRHRHRRLASDG